MKIEKSGGLLRCLKDEYSYFNNVLYKDYLPRDWFSLQPNVRPCYVKSLDEKFIPDGDVLIASSWHTAEKANGYSYRKGRKIYFIQSFETWHGPYEKVIATWKMPFEKVVIAKWLLEIAQSINEKAIYIPNGFDFLRFGIDVDPAQRNRFNVCMLYHEMEVKGSVIGIDGLKLAKAKIPQLNATLFGVFKRPEKIPDWINYFENPTQQELRRIYNNSAIFVNPSLMEGFALTPAEAQACGCAIVVSNIGGHKETAIDNETALLFPSKDPGALADRIIMLVNDDPLRLRISQKGNMHVQRFTWEVSAEKFEKIILEK